MNCGRISNQLSAYVDRELTGAEMLHIRSHLGTCDACRAEYEALCRMKMMLGRLRAPEPNPEFLAAASRRFRESKTRGPAVSRWASAGPLLSVIRPPEGVPPSGVGWARWLGLWPDRVAAGALFCRFVSIYEFARSLAWPRLALGITTAALAAALVHTTVMWKKAPDALVATSPPPLIQGNDPLSAQTLDFQLVSEGGASDRIRPDLVWSGHPGGPSSLPWAPVSFQGERFGGLP